MRQKVADTWIEVRYSRPVARGRQLFGGIVEWSHIWTPGADSATTISVSTPIELEGQPLPQGTYSIWLALDSAGPWTVIFSKRGSAWHTRYPGEASDQLRVRAMPWQGPNMEALAWYFPIVDGREATLVMHWGTTGLPLRLHVPEP